MKSGPAPLKVSCSRLQPGNGEDMSAQQVPLPSEAGRESLTPNDWRLSIIEPSSSGVGNAESISPDKKVR